MTREHELDRAIENARLPARDYRVWRALLKRSQWKTAVIEDRWQPRSLLVVARDARMSVRTVCRGLAHLEAHGWVVRHRAARPGRGHRTTYELAIGVDCDCVGELPEPLSDAERARRYRARQRVRQSVTQATESVSDSRNEACQIDVTTPEKACQIDVTTGQKACQIDVTKRVTSRDEAAGQRLFYAKEGNKGGEGEGEGSKWSDPDTDWLASLRVPDSWSRWPAGSIGEYEWNRAEKSNGGTHESMP